MHRNIVVSLDRTGELLRELKAEYNKSLQDKLISEQAVHLTHEVCERLRSVLDRLARRYWETHVSRDINAEDRAAASVYFPVVDDLNAFDSVLGRWRWKSVRQQHQKIYDYLLERQPFKAKENHWLKVLNDVSVQGKHIDLVPQSRVEETRVTVKSKGGSVSWGPGVTFGSGVYIMGAPVDPRTQRIVPTSGVTESVETWVSFLIEEHGVNALGFCKESLVNTRRVAEEMSNLFDL